MEASEAGVLLLVRPPLSFSDGVDMRAKLAPDDDILSEFSNECGVDLRAVSRIERPCSARSLSAFSFAITAVIGVCNLI